MTQRWRQPRNKDGGDGDGNGDGDNGNEGNDKDNDTDRQKRGGGEGTSELIINGGAIVESANAKIMAGQFPANKVPNGGMSHLLSCLRSHQKKKCISQHLGWDTKCQKNVRHACGWFPPEKKEKTTIK